ncbi:MAG: rod shape-determining protein MreC [Syntrophales bacterium]
MFIPKKYRPHITAAVFLIISLAIISYGASSLNGTGFLRKTVMEIATPFADLVNLSSKGLSNFWRRYLFLVGLEEDNRRLRVENAALAEQLNNYREGYYEGLRLSRLLDLQRGLPYKTVAARVVDNNQNSLFKTILIDKGTADGLGTGYPVVSAQGVTGRIMETSWHSSRVLLMIDGTSNIDAIIQRSRTQGILQGTGRSQYNLKYIPHTAEVLPGDLLISSGMAGVFPKGLIIGIVSKVKTQRNELFQKIDVSPSVDFSRLEEVLVLIPGKEPGQ